MKKEYMKPFAEKIAFNYQEQIVASGSSDSGSHMCTGTRGENYTNCRDAIVWTD